MKGEKRKLVTAINETISVVLERNGIDYASECIQNGVNKEESGGIFSHAAIAAENKEAAEVIVFAKSTLIKSLKFVECPLF